MIFPNIPNLPGVPPLPRLPGAVETVVQLLTSDVLSVFGAGVTNVWGLFLNNAPVVTAESVISFEFKQGYTIATFPVERGSFESYDKVQQPFDVRLRFATGGTLADRQELLESARAACASLDLMDAVTPLATYENINPTHMDYRQTDVRGVGLLVVDLFCEQVRATASSSFTNSATSGATPASTDLPNVTVKPGNDGTGQFNDRFSAAIVNPQSPSAAPVINAGTVQPVNVAPGQFDLSQALP